MYGVWRCPTCSGHAGTASRTGDVCGSGPRRNGTVIGIRDMTYLSLSYDHRLVDGADAARFLVTVKGRLEEGAFEAELGL